tara:strand:+ start:1659 stop:1811 length:153 start_codon:yes stop_codon:yes gene_type:complete
MEIEKDNSTLTERKNKLSLVIEKEQTVDAVPMSSSILVEKESTSFLHSSI